MDGKRFDRMARAIASGTTRRGLIGGLAALLVGGRAAGAAAQGADGCPLAGQTRNRKGDCLCPAGTDPCREAGICADRKRDPFNCGRCGRSCDGGECVKGECRAIPTTPAPDCVTSADCGDPSKICVDGTCVDSFCDSFTPCPSGFTCNPILGGPNGAGVCSEGRIAGRVFDAPAAKVWDALTDADTLTALGVPTDIAPQVGHRFRFHPTPNSASATAIEAEITEIEPLRRVVFQWLNGPRDEPTTVTVTLVPVGDGARTRVVFAHTDRSGESCRVSARVLGEHWGRRFFTDALPNHLAKGQ